MIVAFLIMAVLLIASGVAVVACKNPIHSALALILNLLTVAGVFALLDAHFLAAVQIIVYAGAIMVLVMFVLMLLNLKVEASKKKSGMFITLSVASGCAFLLIVMPLLESAFRVFPDSEHRVVGSIEAIGKMLYTKYLFPFEAASILILAAIAGAVMLAKRRTKGGAA